MAVNAKLHQFIMAALTNPMHPLYRIPAAQKRLQTYAINVKGCGLLETMTAEEWEAGFGVDKVALEECMKLLEAEGLQPDPDPKSVQEIEQLKGKLSEATTALTALQTQVKALQDAAKESAAADEKE